MSRKPFLVMAALLSIAPAAALYAQDDGEKPAPTVRTADGGREAVTRGDRPRAVERSAPQPAEPPSTATSAIRPAGAPPAAAAAPAADDQRRRDGTRDRGDGARDRGDNPAVGRAVPREASPPPRTNSGGGFDGRNRGVFVAPRVYNNYYYNPRRYYPYGYGAFGLGYFYYDPYTWYPSSSYPGYYGSYAGGYYDPFFFDVGELRLIVSPRSADVYVDGYFAGRVDDYDGIFQALKLEAGAHHIQIVAPGHSPLDFDVRIEPNRKITYRGTLRP
ncbi:MAG TPA: hypothetical protein VFU28_15105 [Vicinamibacterales bacterium]|nr:hypothetical protein [Vicinamibacterales bacterium]